MSIFKSIFTTIVNIFSKQFYFLASIASFLGLFIVFVKESWAVYVALSFFCLILITFTSYLVYALFKILEIRGTDHENRSSFVKYETLDGNIITYETYKLIQSKKPILTEMEYSFKWTGTHLPKITSDLQDVVNIVDEQDVTKYDKALLKFRKPIYYNQNCVVHFKAELDDVDKKSLPHVETRVLNEIDIVHYRIILKHKPLEYNQNAILQKCKINSNVSSSFEKIREIPFDTLTKSYEYHLLNPEIGYYYRISWER
ncbi:hypothetical protein EKL97_15365 [Flavobacterium sp. LS1P28]|uniref:hypothetical protein n=1 Tax=Flavobacterium sp. LS1P28 TaxID=2497752 RepID=UPI000F83B463|nr:hypothetical protein [Flavobacterium sp. LS1P28]RTY77488.1 hypothetical protein EKL97_15365 [Flavobacterium sp. LS1P28]